MFSGCARPAINCPLARATVEAQPDTQPGRQSTSRTIDTDTQIRRNCDETKRLRTKGAWIELRDYSSDNSSRPNPSGRRVIQIRRLLSSLEEREPSMFGNPITCAYEVVTFALSFAGAAGRTAIEAAGYDLPSPIKLCDHSAGAMAACSSSRPLGIHRPGLKDQPAGDGDGVPALPT
jgi:hypothetical protein